MAETAMGDKGIHGIPRRHQNIQIWQGAQQAAYDGRPSGPHTRAKTGDANTGAQNTLG